MSDKVSALRAMFEGGDDGEPAENISSRTTPAAPKLLARRREKGATATDAPGRVRETATPVFNCEGTAAALGTHPACRELYYCGQKRDIPGSDGVCGPDGKAYMHMQKSVEPGVRRGAAFSAAHSEDVDRATSKEGASGRTFVERGIIYVNPHSLSDYSPADVPGAAASSTPAAVAESRMSTSDSAGEYSEEVMRTSSDSGVEAKAAGKFGGVPHIGHGACLVDTCKQDEGWYQHQDDKEKDSSAQYGLGSQGRLTSSLEGRQSRSSGDHSAVVAAENTPTMLPFSDEQIPPPLRSTASGTEYDDDNAPVQPPQHTAASRLEPSCQPFSDGRNEGEVLQGGNQGADQSLTARQHRHVPYFAEDRLTTPHGSQQEDERTARSHVQEERWEEGGGRCGGDEEVETAEAVPEEVLKLYRELTEDAKSFAVRAAFESSAAECRDSDQTDELAEEARASELRVLTEDAVEACIREQMLQEGYTPEDIERERERVRDGREGERICDLKDGRGLGNQASSPVAALVGESDSSPDKHSSVRTGEGVSGGEWRLRTQLVRGRAEGDDEQVEGVLWWGARRWDEEAADDMWCNSQAVVAALTQLLRANICLYGQHFAARAVPTLVSRQGCRQDIEQSADLMAAVARALQHLASVVVLSTAVNRTEGTEGLDASEGGESRRKSTSSSQEGECESHRERDSAAEKMDARRNEQRGLVGLGGSLHLCLAILKLGRLGQETRHLMVAKGVVPALCEALAIRVNNPGGPRLHEAAALAAGVLAPSIVSVPVACKQKIECLEQVAEGLVRLCGHCMRHLHALSRRDRSASTLGAGVGVRSGGIGSGSLHHKQLMAMSRVVAASSVALFVLRGLSDRSLRSHVASASHGWPGGAGAEEEVVGHASHAFGVFGNIEVQVVAHVLHALKGQVYAAGGKGLSESCRGWRVLLFLRAIHLAVATVTSASLTFLSRFRDSDVVRLMVSLIVEGEDGQGETERDLDGEKVVDGDEEDQDAVRAVAQDILLVLVQPLAQARDGTVSQEASGGAGGARGSGRSAQDEVDGEERIADLMLEEAIDLCSRRPQSQRSQVLLSVLQGLTPSIDSPSPRRTRPATAADANASPPPPALAAVSQAPSSITPPEAMGEVLMGRSLNLAEIEVAESGRAGVQLGRPSAAAKLAAAAAATAEAAITSRLAGLRLSSSIGSQSRRGEGGKTGDLTRSSQGAQLTLFVDQDDLSTPSGQPDEAAQKSPDNGAGVQMASTPNGTPPASPLTWLAGRHLTPSETSGSQESPGGGAGGVIHRASDQCAGEASPGGQIKMALV